MCITCTGTACNGNLSPSHCPLGKDYCMSSIVDSADGSRNQTRSCVTEGECYSRWIGNTLTSPECMSLIISGSGPSGQNLTCDYCCTRSGCNSVQFPSANTLYHQI
ncbi:uncharacterized protein LOC110441494 [Mizuhopecten yessoensis]|uniref:uncharacterized protein LOC110441494 n=1 Tax=Mizuhopecten yessoensis TaxID=6573 RepID=UPI000B45EC65|nr:uncharacterized protein LOC110441494 [Mizuhopecten yessoensis]